MDSQSVAPEPGFIVRVMGPHGMMAGILIKITRYGNWHVRVPELNNKVKMYKEDEILAVRKRIREDDIEL